MKQRKRWLGLAVAPFALAMLAFAPSAKAADYSGNCAGISAFNGSGNVTINNTGACSLPNPLTATGFIHITSSGAITAQTLQGTDLDVKTTGGAITTQALTSTNGDLKISSATNITTTGAVSSRYAIQANANSGKIAISGNLASNQSGTGGNVLLVATGNISTGSISTNSGGGTAGVEIHANTNAAGGIFTIGASTANGVNTTIDTSNATAGGQNPNFVLGGVFITNGNAGSTTAQIKVTNASNINVASSGSRSGLIYLDSRSGTITLPTGSLSSTGPADQPAGQIVLMAGTLKTVNNTTITASQTAAALSTNHGVIVAASNITVAGAGGLKINGDGNGITGSPSTAYAQIVPTGGITVSSTAFSSNDVNNMLWTPSSITTASTNGPVTVSGAGAFTLTANGNYARAAVYAYPITFSNAAVTITSKGATSHLVDLIYGGTLTGTNGLTLSGTGTVNIDASGSAGNDPGGTINVFVDQATINSTVPGLTIKADGKGTGNGGIVAFQPTKVVSLAAPTVNVSANGASGSVTFNPTTSTAWGDASISSTTFNLNADAPTSATGSAGTIFFAAANSTFGASTKMKFSAIGPTSGSGNGGNITVFPGNVSGGTFKLGTNSGNLQVLANAGSTGGNGGTINVNPFPGSISIETANAVSAAASTGGAANSKGGSVTLIGNPNVTVVSTITGAVINVDGKGTSDGGTIKILGNGTLNLGSSPGSLSLSAKAIGTGNGGTIEVGYTTNLTISGTLSVAGGAGSGSNGKGGSINIHDTFILNAAGATFTADGKGTGFPGTIKLAQTGGSTDMNLSAAQMSASGDPAGDASGHDIDISTPSGINMNGTILKANASNSGNAFGGSVHITSAAQIDLSQPNTSITAKGADNGPGGNVVISRTSPFDVNEIINVSAGTAVVNTNTFGGSISLNSVTCQRRLTGYNWPKVYWNCSNPTSPTPKDGIPAQVASTSPNNATLAALDTILYVMSDQSQFASYFSTTLANSTLGFTFVFSGGNDRPVYTAMFENGTLPALGNTALSDAWLTETTTHELGHSLDISANVESAKAPYINGVIDDLNFLNAAGGGHPCSTNGTAPFDGVTDFQTRQPFCNGAVLNNPNGIYTDPQTGQLRGNADIALISSRNLNEGTLLGQLGYVETFAQAYAYQGYAFGGTFPNGYFDPTADGLFQKNFFQCAQARAATLVGKTYTPTYACN